jgi:DNA end-binding protein Ku
VERDREGYEYEKGKFVVLTDDDFKKAALDSSRTIDIIDFVREDEIDPRYFETPTTSCPRRAATSHTRCFAKPCGRPGSSGSAK